MCFVKVIFLAMLSLHFYWLHWNIYEKVTSERDSITIVSGAGTVWIYSPCTSRFARDDLHKDYKLFYHAILSDAKKAPAYFH